VDGRNVSRMRSVESVIKEIKRNMEIYHCEAFRLECPHLLKDTAFVTGFCNQVIRENLGIKWSAETRADVNLELLELMQRSGCVGLAIALESASERVRTSIKKAMDLHYVERFIDEAYRLGIALKIFVMISMPDETEEEALKTLEFLRRYKDKITDLNCNVTHIYPGTEIEVMAKNRGILGPDFSWYDRCYSNPWPDRVVGVMPLWVEHLCHDFVVYFSDGVEGIRTAKKGVYKLIRQHIKPFLSQWSWSDCRYKVSLLRSMIEIYKFRFLITLHNRGLIQAPF